MSEGGLELPKIARGTLLPGAERLARLELAIPQILAACSGETNGVSVEATLACLLWEAMPQTSWCGFYRRVGEELLSVGPYQGSMGCLRIPFSRGVCGACARTGMVQHIADVRTFTGHIACDDSTLSELVLPVFGSERLEAVLDLDSPHLDAFSDDEARALPLLVMSCFKAVTVW